MSALEQTGRSLDELESIIEHGLETFVEVGQALLEIRDGRKYRDRQFLTFEDYCKERWGMARSRAYQLMDAAAVSTVVDIPVERQARELVPLLSEPEVLREAWAEAQERATAEDKPVTAALVREVVEQKRGMDVHYSSSSDQWSTPQDLFDELDREFGFTLDVCATAENAKCKSFYDRERDGLQQAWEGVCWMNPPYGNEIGDWVRKARESAEAGATVVCLVPARTDTGWWWNHCRTGEVRFLRGRLRFGGGDTGAPFPSAVVVFGRKPKMFCWERGVA